MRDRNRNERQTANEQGRTAYEAGQPIEANPYEPGVLRDEWRDGWMDAADAD